MIYQWRTFKPTKQQQIRRGPDRFFFLVPAGWFRKTPEIPTLPVLVKTSLAYRFSRVAIVIAEKSRVHGGGVVVSLRIVGARLGCSSDKRTRARAHTRTLVHRVHGTYLLRYRVSAKSFNLPSTRRDCYNNVRKRTPNTRWGLRPSAADPTAVARARRRRRRTWRDSAGACA